jgi:hypothetical protein
MMSAYHLRVGDLMSVRDEVCNLSIRVNLLKYLIRKDLKNRAQCTKVDKYVAARNLCLSYNSRDRARLQTFQVNRL